MADRAVDRAVAPRRVLVTRTQRIAHRAIWLALTPTLLALTAYLIVARPPSIAAGTYPASDQPSAAAEQTP